MRRLTPFILALAPVAHAQARVTFTHVSIIDGRDSSPRADQTVIVAGNRIASIGPSAKVRVPPGARIIDGRGKFLIPGLWDMHVHTTIVGGRGVLELYVLNGVTGVRDMAGDWDTLRLWRSEIADRTLIGPRIVASGPYIEGGDIPVPHILARTPAEGIAAVDSLISLGVDFVKVHGQLKPETYFAIARRARERRIPFAGHVSQAVGALAASDSGQKSIEHLLGIPAACTVAESLALRPRYTVQSALGRCTSRDLGDMYAHLVRNGDSLAHYLPAGMREFVAQILPMPDSVPPGADSVGLAMFEKRLKQVAAMHRAAACRHSTCFAQRRSSRPAISACSTRSGRWSKGSWPTSCCSRVIRFATSVTRAASPPWWRTAASSIPRRFRSFAAGHGDRSIVAGGSGSIRRSLTRAASSHGASREMVVLVYLAPVVTVVTCGSIRESPIHASKM
jgi:hypothetical protein